MKIISRKKKWWFILHWKITLTENYKCCLNCIFVFWGTHSSLLCSLLCKKWWLTSSFVPAVLQNSSRTGRSEGLHPWPASLRSWDTEEGAYCCVASLELHLSSTAHLAKVCSKDSAQEGELGATDSLGVFCLFRSSKRLGSASKSMKLCSFPTKK